jgi:hypothetical protein
MEGLKIAIAKLEYQSLESMDQRQMTEDPNGQSDLHMNTKGGDFSVNSKNRTLTIGNNIITNT